jgi:hypothetical protein
MIGDGRQSIAMVMLTHPRSARIQLVYGHAKDQVKKDVDEWVRELTRR